MLVKSHLPVYNNHSNSPGFGGFYNNKTTRGVVNNVTKIVNESGAIFENTFALLLTCILRPAAILLTDAEKRDKEYAAAHSIATGLIGFFTALAVFKPIAKANEKLLSKIEPIAKNKYILDAINQLRGNDSKAIDQGIEELVKRYRSSTDIHDETALKRVLEIKQSVVKHSSSKKKLSALIEHAKSLKDAIRKESLKVPEKLRHLLDIDAIEKYKRVTTQGFRLFYIPLIAFATIRLISPIIKKLFPKKELTEDQYLLTTNYLASQKLNPNNSPNVFSTFIASHTDNPIFKEWK